jgi:hypothetical protein
VIVAEGFRVSENEYDWLGRGVYFFQDAPARAAEWARDHHGADAAVLVARIRLLDCLDLLDIEWRKVLADAHDAFLTHLKKSNLPLPRQLGKAHRLDRAVIDYAVGILAEAGTTIRCVRAAFGEGAPLFPGSALLDRAHIQIAVRDLNLIEDVSFSEWR